MSRKARTCLNLTQKQVILEKLHAGESVTVVARKFGVGKSTICGIKKRKNAILEAVNKTCFRPEQKKCNRTPELPRMEKALYKWFLEQKEENLSVGVGLLQAKAKELHARFNEKKCEFSASNGWVQRFKRRYGIRFLKECGEQPPARIDCVETFKKDFYEKIKLFNLTNHQIYNADDSGLFWKLLPVKNYVASTEETETKRLTLLLCTNASGTHKLKPLVIGKSKNPHSFENFISPLEYRSSKKALMAGDILEEWFHNSFVPQVRTFSTENNLDPKAVLLLTNDASHPADLKSNDEQIFVHFLPPNVSPLIQPMDQNIIRLTKLYYRICLLRCLIAAHDPAEKLKKLTVKDAVLFLSLAWNRLSDGTIIKCWEPLLADSEIPLSILKSRCNNDFSTVVTEVTEALFFINSTIEVTPEDIHSWNNDIVEIENLEDESSDEVSSSNGSNSVIFEETAQVTTKQAIEAIDQVLIWTEENCDEFNSVFVLRKLREKMTLEMNRFSQKN